MSAQAESPEDTVEILLVEDSPTQQEKLKYLLTQHHYRVTTANNGTQALALLSAHKPALVISDVVMPEMDGYAFCKRFKSDKSNQSIPVIILSSLSDSEDVLEGLACGADYFITKPYDDDYLISGIRQILANKDLRETKHMSVGVEVTFAGKKRLITADPQQIISLLLSTYEAAVIRNTELLQTQEALNTLTAELKNTAQIKTEFLSNMSHELRTPLNSINGFSEMLYDEIFGLLNEKQKQYVNNISTSGKHLLLLINQMLDMAKVEAGKMKLELSSLPMKSLLKDISLLMADMISKSKLQMVLEITEDLPNIEADELRVKEILYNLLSNAVKFTPEGGKIGMRAKKSDSVIEIVVWDTGVGIASENMGKIFEGFFRVDTPYSRVTEGTGLGLPLSKKLVELHGGTFSVESEGLKKGTRVRFTLPIIAKSVV